MPDVLTRFGKTLTELHIRQLRTQIKSPWTNGKIERYDCTPFTARGFERVPALEHLQGPRLP